MIKKIRNILILVLFSAVTACSDGTQIEQQMKTLIKKNKLTTLVIEMDGNRSEYAVENIEIKGQFLHPTADEYVNLGRVRTIKVNGKTLEIKL